MSATAAFSGPPTRADFLLVCKMGWAQVYRDYGTAAACLAALSPGNLFVYLPCTAFSPGVIVGQMASGINVISMEGTGTSLQWLGNVFGAGLVPSWTGAGRAGGFFQGVSLYNYFRLKPQIQNGLPNVFVGHSLGAAMALLMGAYAANDGLPVQGVYVAGSPKVGDAAFAASLPFPVYRLENVGDPVPPLPPATPAFWVMPWPYSQLVNTQDYVPVGSAITQDASGTWTAGSSPMSLAGVIGLLLAGSSGTHETPWYVSRLRQQFGTPDDFTPGAWGYAKPWLLADLPVQPLPPLAQPSQSDAVPAGWTQPLLVSYVDCNGAIAQSRVIADPLPIGISKSLYGPPPRRPQPCCGGPAGVGV